VSFFARMIAVIVIIEAPVLPAPNSTPSAQSHTEGMACESCCRAVGPCPAMTPAPKHDIYVP
jgi:hypothetical protein